LHSVAEKLGSVIKTARVEKHLTQKELAERLSITPYYLMSIENKQQIPSSELLFHLIRELDISSDAIFYPEHSYDCELVNSLNVLLNKSEERDIAMIITVLQTLLDIKKDVGGGLLCCTK